MAMWRVCMFLTMKIVSYQVLLMFYFNQRENLILNTGQLQVWNLKTLNFEMFIIGGRDKTVRLWSVRNIGEGDNQVCNWFIKIWTKFYCIILTYSTGCFAFPLIGYNCNVIDFLCLDWNVKNFIFFFRYHHILFSLAIRNQFFMWTFCRQQVR